MRVQRSKRAWASLVVAAAAGFACVRDARGDLLIWDPNVTAGVTPGGNTTTEATEWKASAGAKWWNSTTNEQVDWISGSDVTLGAGTTVSSVTVSLGSNITAGSLSVDPGVVINLRDFTTTTGSNAYSLTAASITGSAPSIINTSTTAFGLFNLSVASGTLSLSGFAISNRVTLAKSGAGTLLWTPGSVASAAGNDSLRVNGGTVLLGGSIAGNSQAILQVNAGGTLDLNGHSTTASNAIRALNASAGSTITSSSPATVALTYNGPSTINGNITGAVSLQFLANNTLTLGGNNSFGTFSTPIPGSNNNSQTINVTNGNGLAGVAVVLNNAQSTAVTTLNFQTASPTIGSLESSNFALKRVTLGRVTGGVVNTTLSVGTLNTDKTFAGIINELAQSGINKVGSGKFTLLGTASYTGMTQISDGTLVVGSGAAQTAANSVNTNNTSNNVQFGVGQLPSGLGVGQTVSGSNLPANATVVGIDSANRRVYFSNNATTNGATTLSFGAWQSLPTSTTVILGSSTTNGTLDLNGSTQRVAGIAVASGTVAASQKIGNSSTTADALLELTGSSSFGGVISDTLTVGNKKTALNIISGSHIFSGANTYTGATSVAAGSLILNNGSLGATAVAIGSALPATLAGTGALGGSLTLNINGKLQPGSVGSVGTVTISSGDTDLSSATSGSTGSLVFDLTASDSDRLAVVAGQLNIGTLDFNDFAFTAVGGLDMPRTFTLLQADTLVGSIGTASGMIGLEEASIFLSEDGRSVLVTVPEPSGLAGVLGLAASGLIRRRKSRSRP